MNTIEIRCKEHPKFQPSFLNISNNKKSRLKCDKCIDESGSVKGKSLSIKTIKESDSNTIFNNWPPL